MQSFFFLRAGVDTPGGICFKCRVKIFLLLCAFALLSTSCTTLSNRRDLYNPSEDAGPYTSLPPAHPSKPIGNPAANPAPLPPAPQ